MPRKQHQNRPSERSEARIGSRPVRRVSLRPAHRSPPIKASTSTSPGARLRLVGAGAPDVKPPTANPTPITGPADPRWVLAIRTAHVMQGEILPPQHREALMRQGKAMGLTAFDCSLILAIIQDRARRGITLDQCPAESEPQLALIPLPRMRPFRSALGESPMRTIAIAVGLFTLQLLLIWAWLGT